MYEQSSEREQPIPSMEDPISVESVLNREGKYLKY